MLKQDLLSFFKAWVDNPRTTGALVPSSKHLAKEMASHTFLNEGVVVELGAGTGVVTEALIAAGVSVSNIIVIEYSAELVKKLRLRYPKINIIEGNAAHLQQLLKNETRPINTVISSLPLRSLPKKTTRQVLQSIDQLLVVGGRYIQFTYGLNQKQYSPLIHCEHIFSKWIWLNFPPARVDVWIKERK
jgi:phospholipid N-methyltransferase